METTNQQVIFEEFKSTTQHTRCRQSRENEVVGGSKVPSGELIDRVHGTSRTISKSYRLSQVRQKMIQNGFCLNADMGQGWDISTYFLF